VNPPQYAVCFDVGIGISFSVAKVFTES